MKSVTFNLAIVFLCGMAQAAEGQSKAIREFTPAEKAVMERSGTLEIHAQQLLKAGKAAEALAEAEESIAKLQTLKPMDVPGNYYLVAQCHLALGNRSQALADFKKCFIWDKTKDDLYPRVGDWAGCATDYAIALSQSGRVNEAKLIYYYVLRNVNVRGETSIEPYPFTVVFDTNPSGEVWDYSRERFQAACLMLKAIATGTGDDFLKWTDEAATLVPNWLYPPLYRGFVRSDFSREAYFNRARSLALTQESRTLVERVAGYNNAHMPASAPNPSAARGKLRILQTSRIALSKAHTDLVEMQN